MQRRDFLRAMALSVPAVSAGCTEDKRRTPAGSIAEAGAPGDGSPAPTQGDIGAGVPLRQNLAANYRFVRDREEAAFAPAVDDASWEVVSLPHTARVEAVVTGPPGSAEFQWQGTAWYRRRIALPPEAAGRRIFLHFEAAMNVAEVWLNGEPLGQHLGGYLPFGFDITDRVTPDIEQLLAVRLDNRDNAITGPKPLRDLDYNMYGGLYRDVSLVIKARLFITDPIVENRVASGGIFVTYPSVSSTEAVVDVRAHIRNADTVARKLRVRCRLTLASGAAVAEATSESIELAAGADSDVRQALTLAGPLLWSPLQPNLYTLHTEILDGENVVDTESTRIGIRRISIGADGFRINGELMFLRGTNRHQEYPYIGYALSHDAQYRDARKIKEAGFDFVRLSHYPPDTAFLDACDELGIVVMNCIPGWQYFNADPAFAEVQFDNCRRMLRRDRNHPSVILWEVSLNETEMPAEFIARTHAIAHEEYPGDQCFTSGWRDGYDVFVQARQHGGCRGITGRACLVSEYGDWEYYAQNAGLNQQGWQDLAPDDQNSRQLRWHGERALLQQATNFQEAHSGNRQTIAFADALWVMFDYNRGYAPDLESSGCMDLFRLPKPSYYFFQSQRAPSERSAAATLGPMVFISTFWTAASPLTVRVFSNCEAVELYVDGTLVERRTPDQNALTVGLAHPPFTFQLPTFAPGTLEAVAFIGTAEAARHRVRTPGALSQLTLSLDEGGRPFASSGKDAVFVHAELRDEAGTLLPDAWENVFFGATGSASLVGANPFSSDGGIASIVLQSDTAQPAAPVFALSLARQADAVRILAGALAVGPAAPAFEVRFSVDGSLPTISSPLYEQPVVAPRVRAALFVAGQAVVLADTDVPLFRLAGSRAPT